MTNEYQEVLAALERRAILTEIQPLLHSLANSSTGINAGIDFVDAFGLTICMRAAAHGRLRVVKAAHELGARIEKRNPFTGANLLHYAAQQRVGGAGIVNWAVCNTSEKNLLTQQILKPGNERDKDKEWDRGNGHTVAFEAVFNNNVPVIEALLALEQQGHDVDFKKPAVHGSSPLGWAFKYNQEQIVNLLMSSPQVNQTGLVNQTTIQVAKNQELAATKERVSDADRDWRSGHQSDGPALDLANELREYIVNGGGRSIEDLLDTSNVDINKPYGRFGQPLLTLVPTHPRIMDNPRPNQAQKDRYKKVVKALLDRDAIPRTKEKGLMEVSAGFREVFFGYTDALDLMIQNVKQSEREDFVNEVGFFNGYTRLIDAALIGNTEATELLLDYGADRRIRGFNGWTGS